MNLPIYIPIEVGPDVRATSTDILDFNWSESSVSFSLSMSGDEHKAVSVRFRGQCIVRLLDEMALSTEDDDSPNQGLVSEHVAYRMEGARFWRNQSEAFKMVYPTARHYRFVTGGTCLDVISGAEPSVVIEQRERRTP